MTDHEPLALVREQMIQRTAQKLEENKMTAYYAPTVEDARKLVVELLPKGCTVACGGSMTLSQAGIMDLLRSGDYEFYDRDAVPKEEVDQVLRKAFFADCYLTSCNAVTEQGELYNVDGNANRVAAMTYGPKSVICVVGYNKIVPDLEAAVARVEQVAAPANAVRLHKKTPCTVTGRCEDCHSPDRICCTTVIHRQQRLPGRIKVILVGEELGY